MQIDDLEISNDSQPTIIAEMSGNHNQSFDNALKIVDQAKEAGVQLLKLQTYTPDTITLNVDREEFIVKSKNDSWNNSTMYSLYKEAHTPWEWQKEIISYSKEKGLICFSAPFDETSVEFLESIDIPAYKIASPEIIHIPLIKEVALTGKPVIISTGMATLGEIDQAIEIFTKYSSADYALLKCTSSYPTDPSESNILTIPYLRNIFGCEVGLSDHTLGIGVALGAIAHGASIIEKHLTLSRALGGVDSAFSLEPNEMKTLVKESINTWKSLGEVKFGPVNSEIDSLTGRRSIYIAEDIMENEEFTRKNLRVVRPNKGLKPIFFDKILGRKAVQKISKGTPMSWNLIK